MLRQLERIANSEIVFSERTIGPCCCNSADTGWLNVSGKLIATNNATKNRKNKTNVATPNRFIGADSDSALVVLSLVGHGTPCAPSSSRNPAAGRGLPALPDVSERGGSRKPGNFSNSFTAVIPAMVEQVVARIEVPMMAYG